MAPVISETYDKYLGRKDICLFTETTVFHLFPLPYPITAYSSKSSPNTAEWLGYVLYRTSLPNQTIFHALHLLRRIAFGFSFDPSPEASPLAHHRLILAALIIATKYHVDDSYSNKSWGVAARGLFSLHEINLMELEMIESLGWIIGEGGGTIVEIIERYEKEYDGWVQELREHERERERERRESNFWICSKKPHNPTVSKTGLNNFKARLSNPSASAPEAFPRGPILSKIRLRNGTNSNPFLKEYPTYRSKSRILWR